MQRVTKVIIRWNSWDILSHCLEKLQGQTFRDFKVLVVDNASDQPAPPELCSRYSNVTMIQSQANLGFAAANNQAIKRLDDSEWVGLFNPDAFPEPDWLKQLLDATQKYPDYTMFASRQVIDGNSNLLDGDGIAIRPMCRVSNAKWWRW
jgi:GT2 family glycosyltransferase